MGGIYPGALIFHGALKHSFIVETVETYIAQIGPLVSWVDYPIAHIITYNGLKKLSQRISDFEVVV